MLNAVSNVIGFDLGHGETSLARGMLDNHEPRMLEINNRKVQVTAIAYTSEGSTLIGDPAFNQPGAIDFQVSFKSRPSTDARYRRTMLDFVNAVYKWLIGTSQITGGGDSYWFIGCPSGWTDGEKQGYQQLLAESSIRTLTVIRESHAALMIAKEGGSVTVGELQGPVLVIDVGSSTTDFTLLTIHKDMDRREQTPLVVGYDLGASLIDKTILEYSLKKHGKSEALKAVFNEDLHYRNRCEYLCRKAKEEYFRRPGEPSTNLDEPIWVREEVMPTAEELKFRPFVSRSDMEVILKKPIPELMDNNWPQAFFECLEEVKERISSDFCITPGAILVTGSASRMDFIQEECKKVFSESTYIRDLEPEFAIAKGLVYWGRFEVKIARFMKSIDEFLEKNLDKVIRRNIDNLYSSLGRELAPIIVRDVLKPRLETLIRDRSMSESGRRRLARLRSTLQARFGDKLIPNAKTEAKLNREIQKWLKGKEAKRIADKVILHWLEELERINLEPQMTDIYRAYDLEYEPLELKADFLLDIERIMISFDGLDNDRATKGILGGAGIGATLLAGLHFGALVAAIVGIISTIVTLFLPWEKSLDKVLKKLEKDLAQKISAESQNQQICSRFISSVRQALKIALERRASRAKELLS